MTNPVCSARYKSFALFIFVAIILGVTVLVTIIGNIMVLLALHRFRKLRTMSNCLIGNLAVSDLLLALTVLPISTGNDLVGYWPFGEAMCTTWLLFDVLYCTASIWGLTTIAVDRYTATIYPMWYHEQRSSKRALAYIGFVWVFSIIVSFAPFIGWRNMIPTFYQNNVSMGAYECVLFLSNSYVVYSASGSFFIPFCLMIFLYARIFSVLQKRSKMQQLKREKHAKKANNNQNHVQKAALDQEEIEMQTVIKESTTTTSSVLNEDLGIKHATGADDSCRSEDELTDKDTTYNYESDRALIPSTKQNNIKSFASETTDSEKEMLVISNPTYQVATDSDREINTQNRNNALLNMKSNKNSTIVNSALIASSMHSKSISILDDLTDTDTGDTQKPAMVKGKRTKRRVHSMLSGKILRNQGLTSSLKRKYELREMRATKRMALIMACFIGCWMPFFFMYPIRSFCDNCPLDVHLAAIIIWLGYVNSTLNPILYTIFNDDFRRAFMRLLGMKDPKRRNR